jgi:hypothetical protein
MVIVELILIMVSLLLDMEILVEKIIGKLKIHGDHLGEIMAISILSEMEMVKENVVFLSNLHSQLHD